MISANESGNAIEVKGLTVRLGHSTILDSLSFTIPIGSTTAIIGPNGAGKSILLKTILNLLPKQEGSIHIFGNDNTKQRRTAPLLSYIPQILDFDREFPLTVQGLFSLKSKQFLGMSSIDRERMHDLLRLVGMSNQELKKLGELSGGQLQRVLIAYSLMDKPKLLLLDEPSSGIDSSGQETIYSLLQRIKKEEGITMVLVSHELDVVMQFADQVLCLNKELLCSGPPKKALSNEILHRMYGTPISHVDHFHR